MIRAYEEKDLDQCLRMFQEVGWMEGDDSDKDSFSAFSSDSRVNVVELGGEAEVIALTRAGSMRYQEHEIPMAGVTGVVASRVARTQGWPLRVTAHSIAETVEHGAAVSVLGMFDQGYYDKLGFGSLPYHRITTVDPASFKVPKLSRSPIRLSKDDAKEIHECRLRRMRVHGSCNMNGVGITECDMTWDAKGVFGLGFRDDDGLLTHFVVCKPKDEHGPYYLAFMAYETYGQFIELLSLIKSLSVQVHGIRIADPPNIQLQDFLDKPLASQRARRGGDFDINQNSSAWMQLRINNVETCVDAMSLPCESFSFHLKLNDPIENFLSEKTSWRGESGNWIITLGKSSNATRGKDESLPTLEATMSGFSRLWIGALTASSLRAAGQINGDDSLLKQLDASLLLPKPAVDWDF